MNPNHLKLLYFQEEGSVATVSNALVIALRTLEKFSTRLSAELLAMEGENVNTVESGTISIIVQVIDVKSRIEDSEVKLVNLPVATGIKYPVNVAIPLEVALTLSTSEGRLAVSVSVISLI